MQCPITNERVIIPHVKLGYNKSKFNCSYTHTSKQQDQISYTMPVTHNEDFRHSISNKLCGFTHHCENSLIVV